MVEIRWTGGRMGNCIFEYVFARLLALQNNLKLVTEWPHQDFLESTTHAQGEIHHEPIVDVIDSYHSQHGRKWFGENFKNKHVVTHGFFQNASYYNNKRETIKGFFALPPIKKMHPNDIVIHYRLTDYYDVGPRDRFGNVPVGSVIDPSWHSKILSSVIHHNKNKGQLYIVTDNPKDKILQRLQIYNPIIVSKTPVEDFLFIRNFNNILCGNSSFSWFASFFSEAKKIYTFSLWLNDKNKKIIRLAGMRGASAQIGSWYRNK